MNQIESNLTDLISKELFIDSTDLTPSEKKIIEICSGIISSMDTDLKDLEKRIYNLEIQNKNKDIIIRDMLENNEKMEL